MNVFLWIVQGLLAAMFGLSGLGKLLQPKDKLAGRYPWAHDFSQPTVWFIGGIEILGAIGLIAPAATGISPILTPIAATGLAVFAVAAAVLHIRRNEVQGVVIVAVLFALSALVAWGRFGPYGW